METKQLLQYLAPSQIDVLASMICVDQDASSDLALQDVLLELAKTKEGNNGDMVVNILTPDLVLEYSLIT